MQSLAWEANQPQGMLQTHWHWTASLCRLLTHNCDMFGWLPLLRLGLRGGVVSATFLPVRKALSPVVTTLPEVTWPEVTAPGVVCILYLPFFLNLFFSYVCIFFSKRHFTGQPLMFKVSGLLSGASPVPRPRRPRWVAAIAPAGFSIQREEQSMCLHLPLHHTVIEVTRVSKAFTENTKCGQESVCFKHWWHLMILSAQLLVVGCSLSDLGDHLLTREYAL